MNRFSKNLENTARLYQALGYGHPRKLPKDLKLSQGDSKINAYQAKLRSLASELELVEERERRIIAMELHDRIGQGLAMAKLKLNLLLNENPSSSIVDPLKEVRELIDEAIGKTRSMVFELSPPILYELGFEAAVDWLCERLEQLHGIPTEIKDDLQPKPLEEDIRFILFRGVRELMCNVAKHAVAKRVIVYINRDLDKVRVTVEDDGRGFDTSVINSVTENSDKYGLFSIKERLANYGGQLEADSDPGSGSRITMTAPLKETEIRG